jgi:hypothetical protein
LEPYGHGYLHLAGEALEMTAAQKSKVSELQLQGFSITAKHKDFIAMQKGADNRLVRTDGSQKRAVKS